MHTRIEDIILLNGEMVATMSPAPLNGDRAAWNIEFVSGYWRDMFGGYDYTGDNAVRNVNFVDIAEWIRPENLLGRIQFGTRQVSFILREGSR